MKYWEECVSIALEDAGVIVTNDQLGQIVDCVEGAHENYGMAHYVPESPYPREIEALKKALKTEREKIHCRECDGSGRITSQGPIHSSNSQCWKCYGEGRLSP